MEALHARWDGRLYLEWIFVYRVSNKSYCAIPRRFSKRQ